MCFDAGLYDATTSKVRGKMESQVCFKDVMKCEAQTQGDSRLLAHEEVCDDVEDGGYRTEWPKVDFDTHSEILALN